MKISQVDYALGAQVSTYETHLSKVGKYTVQRIEVEQYGKNGVLCIELYTKLDPKHPAKIVFATQVGVTYESAD